MSSRHRRVRPRYGRMAAAVSSLGVTTVAVLGGVGMLPSSAAPPSGEDGIAPAAASAPGHRVDPPPRTRATADPGGSTPGERRRVTARDLLPADSGEGRRVVFSQDLQRVWLVGGDGEVRRTHPVSGSLHDNLDSGTYQVYSRSMNAIGVDDSGTMKYFVRFARGDTGAAIGFHDIPVQDGERVQRVAELGTPTSHGCIRQRPADAKAMWAFAQLGTTVVVVQATPQG